MHTVQLVAPAFLPVRVEPLRKPHPVHSSASMKKRATFGSNKMFPLTAFSLFRA